LEKQYKGYDPPCQVDPEDERFVLKGPRYNPLIVLNLLMTERGYKVAFNPQQRSIPLKPGSTDDKFAMIYFLSKSKSDGRMSAQSTAATAVATNTSQNEANAGSNSCSNEPAPPPRMDSLPSNPPDIVSSEQ